VAEPTNVYVMAQTPTTLFPSIGSVADQTDNLQTRETDDIGNPTFSTFSTNDNEPEENLKVVQEVESLCMKQVSLTFFFF
jgi:zinc finger protein